MNKISNSQQPAVRQIETHLPPQPRRHTKLLIISLLAGAIIGTGAAAISVAAVGTATFTGSIIALPIVGGVVVGSIVATAIYLIGKRILNKNKKSEFQPNVEIKPIITITKPAETKPAETKPVETKPVETKPVETKPVETKPTTTSKPAEIKPGMTKPGETKGETLIVDPPVRELNGLEKIEAHHLVQEQFMKYLTGKNSTLLEGISQHRQQEILNCFAKEGQTWSRKNLKVSDSFDYFHIAKGNTAIDKEYKKFFDSLSGMDVREKNLYRVQHMAFLLSPLVGSTNPTNVFEEFVIYYSIQEALKNPEKEESIKVFDQIINKMKANNVLDQQTADLVLKTLKGGKDTNYADIVPILQNIVALFSSLNSSHIPNGWEKIGVSVERWWFQDKITPQLIALKGNVTKPLSQHAKEIDENITYWHTLDQPVSRLYEVIGHSFEKYESQVWIKSKFDSLKRALTDEDYAFNPLGIYQLLGHDSIQSVRTQAFALITQRVWNERAKPYDTVLKKLFIQAYTTQKILEANSTKAIIADPRMSFMILLYCCLQDLKERNQITSEQEGMLKTIEGIADNWNKKDKDVSLIVNYAFSRQILINKDKDDPVHGFFVSIDRKITFDMDTKNALKNLIKNLKAQEPKSKDVLEALDLLEKTKDSFTNKSGSISFTPEVIKKIENIEKLLRY